MTTNKDRVELVYANKITYFRENDQEVIDYINNFNANILRINCLNEIPFSITNGCNIYILTLDGLNLYIELIKKIFIFKFKKYDKDDIVKKIKDQINFWKRKTLTKCIYDDINMDYYFNVFFLANLKALNNNKSIKPFFQKYLPYLDYKACNINSIKFMDYEGRLISSEVCDRLINNIHREFIYTFDKFVCGRSVNQINLPFKSVDIYDRFEVVISIDKEKKRIYADVLKNKIKKHNMEIIKVMSTIPLQCAQSNSQPTLRFVDKDLSLVPDTYKNNVDMTNRSLFINLIV